MPRYIIERRYLLPVYQHLALETPDLELACRKALDDDEGAARWRFSPRAVKGLAKTGHSA